MSPTPKPGLEKMNGHRRIRTIALFSLVLVSAHITATAEAQPRGDAELARAQQVIRAFTNAGGDSIPSELIERARGIAIVPNVVRGGFFLGARRGRGVMSVRMPDGSWSNPAFVTLTGGSIGWQFGADSTDIVLIFANDNAVRNIANGKFTLGGEATAIAGPLRRHASSTMTFRAEVYGYQISRGLYAGAAFQGARLKIDDDLGDRYYAGMPDTEALGHQMAGTPIEARRFLGALDQAALSTIEFTDKNLPVAEPEEARTFPLPD
ncbi:MAG: lipid-binding SYLF domain-containing protein [Gammaproteobacteria bacterium]|jgi:lipid-binding SYLF domain-containing protein